MEKNKTIRGFIYYTFTDTMQRECSIQKSSSGIEHRIWLGADEIGLKHFKKNRGWVNISLTDTADESYIANNRMHLNQEQVRELIPILQKFVETGEI